MAVRICESCGAKIHNPNLNYCPQCGRRLTDKTITVTEETGNFDNTEQVTIYEENTQHSSKASVIVLIVLLAAAVSAGIYLYTKRDLLYSLFHTSIEEPPVYIIEEEPQESADTTQSEAEPASSPEVITTPEPADETEVSFISAVFYISENADQHRTKIRSGPGTGWSVTTAGNDIQRTSTGKYAYSTYTDSEKEYRIYSGDTITIYEVTMNDGYYWYRIADNKWVSGNASSFGALDDDGNFITSLN